MLARFDNTCALILAGGKSRRMQGEDKALLKWKDQPLIEYTLQIVRPSFKHIIISANRNLDTYNEFSYPVIEDSIRGYHGPLAGILSAMQHCPVAEYILVLPCDCPTIPADLFQRLASALESAPTAKIVIVHDGNRLQPLFGLYHLALQSDLELAIQNQQFKVQRFVTEHDFVSVDFSDQPDAFKNFNTPEDLQ